MKNDKERQNTVIDSVRGDLDKVGISGWRAFYMITMLKQPPDDWIPPHWKKDIDKN